MAETDARGPARGAAGPGDLLAAERVRRARGHLRRGHLRGGRGGPSRASGPSRPRRCTGTSSGTRCSTGRTRRSPSGSSAASSTSPTTASTATSRPATATASRSTGAARRARSATSRTPTCTATSRSFANALKDRGIGPGDVVGIFLPMIPEVAVAMLACARIGAPHNLVFGGFSRDVGQGADGVLRGQGADHRRRRAAQGQDRADQAGGRRGDGRPRPASRRSSSSSTRAPTAR